VLLTTTPLFKSPFFGFILLCPQGEKMWLQLVGGQRRVGTFARGIGQKNAAFWTSVASHYARHKPDGGVDRPARSLETKWCDIKVVVAKFTGCYWTIKDVDESGKIEDIIVLDAMNLYKQKCGKAYVFKHCWLLLKNYLHFAAIFMGKRKAA
jgi:hypothetical protein